MASNYDFNQRRRRLWIPSIIRAWQPDKWMPGIPDPLAPKRGLRPLGKSSPPYGVMLKLEATGQLNGRPLQVETSIEHEDGYELTAVPVVALILQYNQIRQAGLHMVEHLAEPEHLLTDMQRMGVQVTTSIR